MKLIECKTLLPTLVIFENEFKVKESTIVFLDLAKNEVYSIDKKDLPVSLKQEILSKYVRKPLERPNMPNNGWNY